MNEPMTCADTEKRAPCADTEKRAPCADTERVEKVLSRYPREEPSLIHILLEVQREYNYLPCEALTRVGEALDIPLSRVFSVATFYRAFSIEPQGRVIVKVCTGTACHIRGAPQLLDELSRRLEIQPGETTVDLGFTIKTVNCVGACAMAPLVIVNEKYHGNAKPVKVASYLGLEEEARCG